MKDRLALGRRELNKLQTREALLGAAKDVFVEHGSLTTVEEIADRAMVSRATFFNYFPSKDALLGALYDELLAQLEGVVDDLLARDLETGARVAEIFADFARNAEGAGGFLLPFTAELDRAASASQVGERGQQLRRLLLRVLETGAAAGDIRTDYPLDFLAQMTAGIYVAAMQHGWSANDPVEFREGFDLAGRFAAEMVRPR